MSEEMWFGKYAPDENDLLPNPEGYVWAYERSDCWRVLSPYMGDTHRTIEDAEAWHEDEYEDTHKYLDLRLFALVPVTREE